MTVDYDGVIIGGTLQGREAAALGAREGARMALVEPPGSGLKQLRRQLTLQILAQAAAASRPASQWHQFLPPRSTPVPWAEVRQRVAGYTTRAYPHLSLEALAIAGVDVVPEQGQLSPRPQLAVTTAKRRLTGRRYLLCLDTTPTVPQIPGLAQTPYLTVDTLADLDTQPQDVVVLGDSADGIAIAQSLALLGSRVTLISRHDRLLPTEDPAMATFVESLLRAAGVTVQVSVKIDRICDRTLTDKTSIEIKWTDREPQRFGHLLLATARQPHISSLDLDRVGIVTHQNYIPVDDRLQTTHPRVFACGPALGGYWAETTDHQDMAVGLRNALYFPRRQLMSLHRIGHLHTVPGYARLGFTATQAQHWYGADAQVLQISLGQVANTQTSGDITGFCRWVVHRDGRLLGAQLCSSNASELIQPLARLMQQGIRMHEWESLPWLPHSLSEIIPQLVALWQQHRWQPGTWRRDWAENWFNWRRSRCR